MAAKIVLAVASAAALAAALAPGAFAGEEAHTVQMFKFATDGGQTRQVRLDSDEMGFMPQDLADGETRTVTTGDGQVVNLTRNGDSLSIGLDGETFEVPLGMHLDGAPHGHRVVKMVGHDGAAPDADSLLIVSGETLDERTRQLIRSALESSGIDKDVRFVDGDFDIKVDVDVDDDGQHTKIVHKRVVKQRVTD